MEMTSPARCFQFSGKDKMEWSLKAHDANGKLMLDIGGTQTRKGTANAE